MSKRNLKGSILLLRKEGKSVREIQNVLGCSKSTISYHIQKAGMGGVHEKFKIKKIVNEDFLKTINEEDVKKIINLRKEGKTYKYIFKKLNISYDKIKRVCSIFNINKDVKQIKFDNPEFINEAKRLYNEIGNIKKVAKKLGTSHQKLRSFIEIKKRKGQTKKERRKSMVKHVDNHRKKMKFRIVDYKGGKCEICGYNKSVASLTFHHINPKDKNFTIGGRNYSWKTMKNEVDKCVLVCANCHGEIHEEIREKGECEFLKNYKK